MGVGLANDSGTKRDRATAGLGLSGGSETKHFRADDVGMVSVLGSGAAAGAGASAAIPSLSSISHVLDIDGCLLNDGTCVTSLHPAYIVSDGKGTPYHAAIRLDVYNEIFETTKTQQKEFLAEHNRLLLSKIRADFDAGHKVLIASGSRRDSLSSDLRNLLKRVADGSLMYFGSVFEIIPYLADYLGVPYSKVLLSDFLDVRQGPVSADGKTRSKIVCDHEVGSSFDIGMAACRGDFDAIEKYYPAGRKMRDESGKISDIEFEFMVYLRACWSDSSKIMHILTHLYSNFSASDFAAGHICNFYDDQRDLLDKMAAFFRQHPYLLPRGVELRLHYHVCKAMQGSCAGEEQLSEVAVIHGAGDLKRPNNFKDFIRKLLVAYVEQFKVPDDASIVDTCIAELDPERVHAAMEAVGWEIPKASRGRVSAPVAAALGVVPSSIPAPLPLLRESSSDGVCDDAASLRSASNGSSASDHGFSV